MEHEKADSIGRNNHEKAIRAGKHCIFPMIGCILFRRLAGSEARLGRNKKKACSGERRSGFRFLDTKKQMAWGEG